MALFQVLQIRVFIKSAVNFSSLKFYLKENGEGCQANNSSGIEFYCLAINRCIEISAKKTRLLLISNSGFMMKLRMKSIPLLSRIRFEIFDVGYYHFEIQCCFAWEYLFLIWMIIIYIMFKEMLILNYIFSVNIFFFT